MVPSSGTTPPQRLSRAERREQIVVTATHAFSRAGFAGTSLDDVAAAAGVSRAIVYRHFDSKSQLYVSVLEHARRRLHEAVGDPPYAGAIVDDLLQAAANGPDGFRLLFHRAAREPEFREENDRFGDDMVEQALAHLAPIIGDPGLTQWAAHLAPTVAISAITAWLDAGQPDPEHAPARIRLVLRSIIDAARTGIGNTDREESARRLALLGGSDDTAGAAPRST